MKTVLTRSATEAARFIRLGGIVAFPTETVYGLGANIFDENAIRKIFTAKTRPADNPLIAHITDVDQIPLLAADIPPDAEQLIQSFFPGPLTIVLRKSERVPLLATSGLATIGIRMPQLRLANQFLRASGTPVAAPSANLSGRPSPTTWQAVLEDLDGRIDCILQGEPTEIGLESTVVDCTSATALLLRKGAVSLESLRRVIPQIRTAGTDDTETLRSPGLRHKHYSPRARVVIVSQGEEYFADPDDAFIGLNQPIIGLKNINVCGSVEAYASALFEFFRECDRSNVQTIYCEAVNDQGIGAALMDRIRRASES
ncbi:MAG: L-threonylcarbamoyladenylate synthase [Pyrinomonadaceae bacterium]